MKIYLTLIIALLLSLNAAPGALTDRSPAATNAPAPAKPVRFLFLVDNSTSMRRNAEMTEATVGNLIFSGAYGTMRPGDSYTIWRFVDKVEAKEFPVRFWYPNEVHTHTSAAREYIKNLTYSGKGELDHAVATIKGLAQLSGLVTVFLITDGQAPLYGTPFDLPVTTIYVQHGPTLAKEKKPFVTTFLMVDGKFESWSVEAAGGKITMPRIPADVFARYYPPEPAPAKPVAKAAPVVAPKIVRPPAQSIIVKGPIKPEGTSTTQPAEPVKVLPDPVFPKSAPATQTLNVLPPTPAIAPTTTTKPAVVIPVLPVAQPALAPL
ncbi:MAG TPA: hypothetical protein VK968_12085, partial [Roseimicrobium sp.]|nr:hypothetical protein [Roseimicrobium sp.]